MSDLSWGLISILARTGPTKSLNHSLHRGPGINQARYLATTYKWRSLKTCYQFKHLTLLDNFMSSKNSVLHENCKNWINPSRKVWINKYKKGQIKQLSSAQCAVCSVQCAVAVGGHQGSRCSLYTHPHIQASFVLINSLVLTELVDSTVQVIFTFTSVKLVSELGEITFSTGKPKLT